MKLYEHDIRGIEPFIRGWYYLPEDLIQQLAQAGREIREEKARKAISGVEASKNDKRLTQRCIYCNKLFNIDANGYPKTKFVRTDKKQCGKEDRNADVACLQRQEAIKRADRRNARAQALQHPGDIGAAHAAMNGRASVQMP
jgi:hypothetical protein